MTSRERNPKFPSFWQALGILAAMILLEVAIAVLFMASGMRLTANDPRSFVVTLLATGVVVSFVLAHKQLDYARLFSPDGRSLQATMLPLLPPLLLMSAGTYFLSWEFSNLAGRIVPVSDSTARNLAEIVSGGFAWAIVTCILAPVIEEMLFRGVFLRSFLRVFRPWTAIALSALLFGLRHLDPGHIVVATAGGFVLGWLYTVTRSLWPSIVAHALQNACIVLHVHLDPDGTTYDLSDSLVVLPVPLLAGAVAAFVYGARQVAAVSRRSHPEGDA